MTPAIPLSQWPGTPQYTHIGLVSFTITVKTFELEPDDVETAPLKKALLLRGEQGEEKMPCATEWRGA